jgi:hypothetical protein
VACRYRPSLNPAKRKDARIAEGSDYIKIIHDDGSTFASTFGTKILPTVNNATMGALVEAAHKRGKLVMYML